MIKCASLFSQILNEISSSRFAVLTEEMGNDRNAKGFTSWMQLVSMLFSHLARADSLREITNGLICCNGKIRHLGMASPPKRSTLAYANEHRSSELYRRFFWTLLDHFREMEMIGCVKKFRFKNKLLLFDSTTISLCLSLFPWADYRRAKGGVKVHVLLDASDYMPSFVNITEARLHDSAMSKNLTLKSGSIIALDRGYVDFEMFDAWDKAGVIFVTRMKDNIRYNVTDNRGAPDKTNVMSDEEKERWQIELFFKTLKQTLNVKSFVGTSENALRIQIWTAMTALLVIKWLHHLSHARWSVSVLSTMLRLNLFSYRPLLEWLDEPYETPPAVPVVNQLTLF